MHAVHTVVKILYTLCSLWREEFEGEGRIARPFGLCQHIFNVHGGGQEAVEREDVEEGEGV